MRIQTEGLNSHEFSYLAIMQTSMGGFRIAGIAAAVPEKRVGLAELAQQFGEAPAAKLVNATGVNWRHVASDGICASDLCFAAARRLLDDLSWPAESIDVLVFVSQTPDYRLPATSCVLHERLGLSKQCAAFDVNLGCSGYVYGLWMAAQTLVAGGAGRALLLVGDTISRTVAPGDRATAPLFGDGGSATALERDSTAGPTTFVLGTDGAGHRHIMIPAGGFRESGNAGANLSMNGAEVFEFTLREVPPMIDAVLAASGWTADDIDAFVFHQANRFLLDHLAKKMKLPADKMMMALDEFGNTSSASIPIAMARTLSCRLGERRLRLALAGFGVGWSWAAATLECGPIVVSEPLLVPAGETQ